MSVHQLCISLFCSVSSLRRDLIELEKTGSIRHIRGGATLVVGTTLDYSINHSIIHFDIISGISHDTGALPKMIQTLSNKQFAKMVASI